MISQNFEPSRGRAAKVLVQKLLRAVEAEIQGLEKQGLALFGCWVRPIGRFFFSNVILANSELAAINRLQVRK